MDVTTVLYIVAVVGYSLYQGYNKRKARQQGDKPVQEAENTELPDWMKEIFAEEPKPVPRPKPQAPPPMMEAKPMEPEPMVVKPMKTSQLGKKYKPIATTSYETLEDYRPDNRSLETIKEDRIQQMKKDTARAAFMEADSAIYNKAIADLPEETDFAVDAESLRKGIVYGEILAKRY
jgi:hypothetical protein